MPIQITASTAGFHFENGIGDAVAPEVFFAGIQNRSGQLFQVGQETTWATQESFDNPNIHVEATLARDAALPPGARAGDETQLAFSGFTFSRVNAGQTEVIGQVEFTEFMTVDAVFHPNGASAVGGGSQPNWIAEVGQSVSAAAIAEGFVFTGSDGVDVFDPNGGLIPLAASGDIFGHGGDDYLTGQRGGATIYGGTGDDQISTSGGTNSAFGGSGNDLINFTGRSAAQKGFGGKGRDQINGGDGDDFLRGGAGRDRINGDDGNDNIAGGGGRDFLNGGAGDDRIAGGSGKDRLIGNAGNDTLSGGDGRDILHGGQGADTLIGGAGDDRLSGGAKADTFVFRKGHGNDTITDFNTDLDNLKFEIDGLTAADLTITAASSGALIEIADLNQTVLLRGVEIDELSADAFLF
ncbi:MAG: calcium-binding protein [Pikeienuella sp.]